MVQKKRIVDSYALFLFLIHFVVTSIRIGNADDFNALISVLSIHIDIIDIADDLVSL